MADDLTFDLLGPGDYERAKTVLNKAKHPGFVGRELFFRCATTGTCTIAVLDGADVGVALVASQKLQALSVVSSAQGDGIGARLIDRVQPRWASVIGDRVEWFKRRGYVEVGPPKVSQKGTTTTQLMERTGEPEKRPPEQLTEPTRPRERVAVTAEEGRKVGQITRIMQQGIECERMIASLLPPSAITLRLMEQFGMTRRQARAYQAGVRGLWRQQDGYEGREQRIAKYRRALEQQAEAATRDGDRRSAIAALAVLVKMEGGDESAGALPANGETPAASSEVQVVDRQDMHETLRAMRAKASGGG